MAGNANDALKGGAQGAAVGAPFGPYGAAGGAAIGATLGYLNGGESDEEKAQRAAEAAKLSQDKQAAIALSNYRQTNRDQSHRLLQNRMAPYQEYSNRLAAGWGAGMSTAGLSAAENPVTLRDTGIGAAEGSNYTGWNQDEVRTVGGNHVLTRIHHKGIGEYLDGTGDTANGNTFAPYHGVSGDQRSFDYSDTGAFQDRNHPNALMLTQYQDGAPGVAALGNEQQQQMQLAQRQAMPAQPQRGAPGAAPNGGFSFAPRRA